MSYAAAVAESLAMAATTAPGVPPIYRFDAAPQSVADRRAQLDAQLDAQFDLMQQDALDTSGPEFSYLALLRERYAGCAVDMAAHLAHKVARDNVAVTTMLLVFFACRRDSEMVGGLLGCLAGARRPHESTLAALVELSARRRDLATLEAVVSRCTGPLRPVRGSELRDLGRFWRQEDRVHMDALRPARIAAAADILVALRRHGMPCPLQEVGSGDDDVAADKDYLYNAEEEEDDGRQQQQ